VFERSVVYAEPMGKPSAAHSLKRSIRQCLLALLAVWACAGANGRELHSYALVQDDGSLLISGETVHLYGVYLPETDRTCDHQSLPVRCAPRSVLSLEFKIQGFVHCYPRSRNSDGSLNAVCYTGRNNFSEGEDLAAYLIKRGWALALPDAPFEYHAMERIARHNHRGVWASFVDGF